MNKSTQQLIEEWLAKGNQITKLDISQNSDNPIMNKFVKRGRPAKVQASQAFKSGGSLS